VLPRSILACLVGLFALGVLGGGSQVTSTTDSLSFLYTIAKDYDPLAWSHGAERFPSGAAIYLTDGKGQHPLVHSFAASADSVVSFDGKRVLFAG